MNLVPFVAAVTITCGVLASQVNLAEIYPGSNCTNFTSRGSLGSNGGEILLEWPVTHFSGIGHDRTGRGTILSGFVHVVQDQYAATPSTYSVLVRRGVGGRPSTDAAGHPLADRPVLPAPGQRHDRLDHHDRSGHAFHRIAPM